LGRPGGSRGPPGEVKKDPWGVKKTLLEGQKDPFWGSKRAGQASKIMFFTHIVASDRPFLGLFWGPKGLFWGQKDPFWGSKRPLLGVLRTLLEGGQSWPPSHPPDGGSDRPFSGPKRDTRGGWFRLKKRLLGGQEGWFLIKLGRIDRLAAHLCRGCAWPG